MQRKLTDIAKIYQIRQALQNLQNKIDNFLSAATSLQAQDANKHISLAIRSFSKYTQTREYELLTNYNAHCSTGQIFQHFDHDFEKFSRKRTFTLEEIFKFGQSVLNTRALVNAELDYIDYELL